MFKSVLEESFYTQDASRGKRSFDRCWGREKSKMDATPVDVIRTGPATNSVKTSIGGIEVN